MAQDELEVFFSSVVTTSEGWFQLLIGPRAAPPVWGEEWFHWPEDLEKIAARVREASAHTNVYFSPHLFKEQNSHKDYVIADTRTFVVDLDNADVTNLRLNPTILIESSKDRHQGYWVVKEFTGDFETTSKQLSYTIPNADHSGWSLGHKFRIPGTRNFKYPTLPVVRLVPALSTERQYAEEELTAWVSSTDVLSAGAAADDEWIADPPSLQVGPRELLEKFATAVGPKMVMAFEDLAADRSEALWALMSALYRAGATRDEVYWIAKHSANNKFADHKYYADRDLAKDVDRARRANESDRADISSIVQLAERTKGSANDRKRLITKIVISDMQNKGEFIYTDDGRFWYIQSNAGRPMLLGKRSEMLDSQLDMVYGLNAADGYQPYVVTHLNNYTLGRGKRAISAVLSYYDGESVLLHSGKSDVFRITPSSVDRIPDGQYGVLFPWRPLGEEVIQIDESSEMEDWSSWMFEGWFDNLMDFTPTQAKLLIRIWFLFVLFRDEAISRPILAMLGQPGSGKSTLFHLFYQLMYGKNKSVNSITSPDDFDFLVASDPVVFFDNVDGYTNWLADRLALSASASDLTKRKLYTDSDTITLKRQAIVGLTAHDPKFGRADVIDRLLILNFQRRTTNIPEGILAERLQKNRAQVWGAIVRDVQLILKTPNVPLADIPNFRSSDFARFGARVATALGKYDEFVELVTILRRTQTAFSLSEEDVLIDAIKRWHNFRNGTTPEFAAVGYLWEQFSLSEAFQKHFKSPNVLSRRLWTLQSNLKSIFTVDYRYDNVRGVRTWKIDPQEGPNAGKTDKAGDGQH